MALNFPADYQVRSPGRQNVKGADAILISLCKYLIMDARKKAEKGAFESAGERVKALEKVIQDLAQRNMGPRVYEL